MRKELTQERLKEVLHYDLETGDWTWLVDKATWIPAGRPAGYIDKTDGYHKITLDGVSWKSHRLAFLYVNGNFPAGQVDHKNRDRTDVRWENLRIASSGQNAWNGPARKNNACGLKGVSYRSEEKRYISRIYADGACYYLGCFTCPREAAHAYNVAAIQLHGEFAVLNPI